MKAFTACPQCGKIVTVRRNGKVKFHRVKVWDEKTQTGRHARCSGTNQKVSCEHAWMTYQAAEEAIGKQRDATMKELTDAAKRLSEADHEAKARRREAEEGGSGVAAVERPGLILPGQRGYHV